MLWPVAFRIFAFLAVSGLKLKIVSYYSGNSNFKSRGYAFFIVKLLLHCFTNGLKASGGTCVGSALTSIWVMSFISKRGIKFNMHTCPISTGKLGHAL